MPSNLNLPHLSVAAGSPASLSACRVYYEPDRAKILFASPVTDSSILWVCDEIETALNYYHYSEIELQIDSPGGSVAYLEYYLARLQEWRRRPSFRLSTTALTQAASAAGVMLCLGDIGRRRAYAGAKILLHDVRIEETIVMDKGKMGAIREVLEAADTRLVKFMARHIYSKILADLAGAGGSGVGHRQIHMADHNGKFRVHRALGPHLSEAEITRAIERLQAVDLPISPQTACDMLLIDEVIPGI